MTKVLCGGCFNTIHPGHEYFLEQCASLGDELVVVVANDVNNTKSYARPQEERKHDIEELGIADKVVIGDYSDMLKIVYEERPSVIALGYDQDFDFMDILKKNGMRIKRIGQCGNYKTRDLL